MHNPLKNERGMALAFTAVALAAFLALVVVGVDLSRLAFTATEVQTVADIAATAGARRLYDGGDRERKSTPTRSRWCRPTTRWTGPRHRKRSSRSDVDVGRYDLNTTRLHRDTPTSIANAVRGGSGRKTVTNFVAAAFGPSQATTTVHKTAIAAIDRGRPSDADLLRALVATNDRLGSVSVSTGSPPCLPLASPDCEFDPFGQLPSLRVSNNTNDTAGWTAFESSTTPTPYEESSIARAAVRQRQGKVR